MIFRALLSLVLLTVGVPLLQAGVFQTFEESKKAQKAGNQKEFYRLNLRMVDEAEAENLPHYAYIGAYNASTISYREHRLTDCLAQAEIGTGLYQKHGSSRNFGSPWYELTNLSLWGLTERCHSRQMRPGEGWKAQRKSTALWHKMVGLPFTPGQFDIAAIGKLKPDKRSTGWRQIGREAKYLHDFGQTTKARDLLRRAIERYRAVKTGPSVYGMQLLDNLAIIESFIGLKENAIALNRQQIGEMEAMQRQPRPPSKVGIYGAKLNLIGSRADFEGPSPELIAQARILAEEAQKIAPKLAASFQKTVISIESQLENSTKGYAELEKLAQEASANGQDLDAFYLGRNALFLRAKATDENLDSHFNDLLAKTRRTGLKRSEPRIYRKYGDWLTSQARFGEAIAVYREALTLSKNFEWHSMIPRIYGRMGLAFQKAGQEAAADAIWQESAAYLKAHPEIPVQSILKGWEFQLSAYLASGREAEGITLIQKARAQKFEGGLKPYWTDFFRDERVAEYRQFLREQSPVAVASTPSVAGLQPSSLSTVALPETTGAGVFHLVNHGINPLSGTLNFTGPGASTAAGHQPEDPAFQGDLSKEASTVKIPLTLMAGTLKAIPVSLPPQADGTGAFTLTWAPITGTAITSTWACAWGGEISEAVVLESADLIATPFIGVPVIHHIGFPKESSEGDTQSCAIRAKGSIPLRVEYRDPDSGDLLAIDANGDGDFTDRGEYALSAESAPTATSPQAQVQVQARPGQRTGRIEIWIYPVPESPWTEDLELSIELHRGENWQDFATDLLKVGS